MNYFQVNASVPLRVWRKKGWIYHEDPRGWFQWYCRYYMGRRCVDDERQIKRWRAIRRHIAQIKNNCPKRELECRPKQRQAFVTRYAALMRNGFDAPPDVLLKKFLNLDLNDPRTTANALALIEAKIRLLEQSYGL